MLLLLQEPAWANRTSVHWAGLTLTLTLAYALLLLPRRWATLSMLMLAALVPAGQRVIFLTLDFSFLRILLLFGWMRVTLRREVFSLRIHPLDLVVLASMAVGLSAFTLSRGSSTGLIFKLGATFDALGSYALFRCLIREWEDLECLASSIALISIPVALAFVVERATGRNLFSSLGGVPELTEVRGGRLRCQGAFGHPILAGCFWASAWPLALARLWGGGVGRMLALSCSFSVLTIIYLSASSTPVLAAGMVLLASLAYPLRRFFSALRWAALATLIGLQLVMNNAVWHLFTRVNVVGGSTGWHRYYLIDEAVKHFDEWWLVGTPSTDHWGRGLGDITNQFVLEAVQGGLFGLLLFVALAVLGFRAVGRLWRAAWPDSRKVALAWALGTSVLVQCVSFFGVAFFDQTGMLWYLVLACIASLATAPEVAQRVRPCTPRSAMWADSSLLGRPSPSLPAGRAP